MNSCDDFLYLQFWKGGLVGFLRRNLEHYRTVNGRVFVHLVCQTVLSLGQVAFAAVAVGIYLTLCYLVHRLFGTDEQKVTARQYAFSALAFALLFLLWSRKMVLGKAILWISSYFNYIFPAFFICLTMVFILRREHIAAWRYLLIGALLSFLSGATTEQSGVVVLVLLGCLFLERTITEKRFNGRLFFFCVCAFVGYLTIFLSPATRGRAARDISFEVALNTLGRIAVNTISVKRSLSVLVAFSAAVSFASFCGKLPKINRLFLPLTLCLIAFAFLPGSFRQCTVMLLIFLMMLLVFSVSLIFHSKYRMAGYYALAILCSLLLMPMTNNAAIRISLPLVFGILLLTLWLASTLAEEVFPVASRSLKAAMALCLCVTAVVGGLTFIPTLRAFASNHNTELRNAQAVLEAQETGILNYCTDYDPQCCYMRVSEEEYARENFLRLYDLEGAEIRYYSMNGAVSEPTEYYLSDYAGLDDSIISVDGTRYASLRMAIVSAGGYACREEMDHMDIELGGKQYIFDEGRLFDGKTWTDIGAQWRTFENKAYLDIHVLEEYFSLLFDFKEKCVSVSFAP